MNYKIEKYKNHLIQKLLKYTHVDCGTVYAFIDKVDLDALIGCINSTLEYKNKKERIVKK